MSARKKHEMALAIKSIHALVFEKIEATEKFLKGIAVEGIARTTNALGGWRYGIQSVFSGSHVGAGKFLSNLQKYDEVQK